MDETLFELRTKQLALRFIQIVDALCRRNQVCGCAGQTVDPIWHFD